MLKAFRLEWFKSRRRHLILIAAAMVLIECAWMLVGLNDMTADEKASGYAYCLYQAPILNAIILPVLISVMVSRLCDMEHKGDALKALFTMQSPGSLFTAKFLCEAALLLLAAAGQALSFIGIADLLNFTEALPKGDLVLFVLSQWAVSLFLALIIQILALRYVNQFIPLVAGLIGGFLGLMSMFFSPVVMRCVPSAYYGLLSTVRMDWNSVTREIRLYYVPFSIWDLALPIAAGTILFVLGRNAFRKREV